MTEQRDVPHGTMMYGVGPLTEHDIYLFREGTHFALYEKMGAQPMIVDGVAGTHFAVWAPNAARVSVVGDWNGWTPGAHDLKVRWDSSGIWEGFIAGVGKGARYKYFIESREHAHRVAKGDPFAMHWETPPGTASIVWGRDGYAWEDGEWMRDRHARNALDAPMSIYEVHLGSWRRGEGGRHLTYRELAEALPDHVAEAGFTHVEFLPVMEHPFYGSWGYQTVGYFAPSSRYGTPEDFMALIDALHRRGIGVILDWVPSHFPGDEHGLVYFDGTHLFEHADRRKGFHPDWDSWIFNYGRHEVRAFLGSSALFWMERFHADGLRVDAVASMLYLDYSRGPGEWIPNRYGGRENLEAISFLKAVNEAVYRSFPDTQTIAEESTAWPMVSRPVYVGGLGFGLKWNMGWMHDTLEYFALDPIFRKYHHNRLTFSIWYAFFENFVLALSHDEVVHGKGSLLHKLPGDDWQKFATLRALLGYMYGHPGKKLLFMGAELAQRAEWNHEDALEWHLLRYPPHQGVFRFVQDLNRLYREEPALFDRDFTNEGFEWADFRDWEHSVVAFFRKPAEGGGLLLVVCNFTPVPHENYRVGVPAAGIWREVLNSDAEVYGGSGWGNFGAVAAEHRPSHGHPWSLSLSVPPLGVLFLRSEG
ncbi:MAG: 1,4-alpha-glucan branching protein GlgB [Candidatus Bathyarchaeota archaeon]|nr:1,4-alpha-glucan branching protein GlgB [Candidatus Bathyarchaeota archaeon]